MVLLPSLGSSFGGDAHRERTGAGGRLHGVDLFAATADPTDTGHAWVQAW
jgi:hypothetical protein